MNTSHPPRTSAYVDLVLLGIGGAFDADNGLANTNAVLEVMEEEQVVHRVLVDCGHTCGRQLAHLGLGCEHIDEIIITHTHGDHIDGLEVLGYRSLFIHKKQLPIISPAPVLEMIWSALEPKMGRLQTGPGQAIDATTDHYYRFVVAGTDPMPLAAGRFTVQFFPVNHIQGMPAFGLLFDLGTTNGGPLIRWSGDTIFDPSNPIFAGLDMERGDRIFHDCAFYPHFPSTVHTHFSQLQTLPADVRKSIVLVHHGHVEPSPAPRDEMSLGQRFDRFRFRIA